MQLSAPPQPPALAPGTLLAERYLIQKYIGGGGFGHIYRAQDKVLGHRRAIKEAFYRDPNTQRQFRFEAEFLINARHPNLLPGYAFFEQAGRFYLVMDYVDGFTLEDITIEHIRRTGSPLSESQILDWMIPVCDAVQSLHQQPTPIIHRDIKPANIKLNGHGIPVLIDLGLAKLYYRGSQTIGAALAFTPGYAPPEQYQASGATDQRTDVYGMGAALYYLLTGYQPTESPARLSSTLLPSPCQLNPVLSRTTEAAVLRAMTLDPAARQQSMRALMLDLSSARSLLTTGKVPLLYSANEPHLACIQCGTANVASARFCRRCGAPTRRKLPDGEAGAGRPDLPLLEVGQSERPYGAAAAAPVATPLKTHAPLHSLPRGSAPSPVAVSQRRSLLYRAPADSQETLIVLAVILGAITFSLSLLASLAGWLLIFLAPALGLAGWSCWQWWWQPDKAPTEFKWLGAGVALLSAAWIAFYIVMFHLPH